MRKSKCSLLLVTDLMSYAMNSIFEAYVCIAEGKFSSGNSLYAVLIGR
jgi:hypothetical protein